MRKRASCLVEGGFKGISGFYFRHPLVCLLTLVFIAGLAASQARMVTRDGSIEGFFQKDAVEITAYSDFRRQFGQDGQIVIAVESENLFTAHMLRKLAEFHGALAAEVPLLEDITSLVNARSVVGGEGVFVVNDLLDHFLRQNDSSETALAEFREQVLSHPIYRDLVISEDGKMTLITLRPQRFQPRNTEILARGDLDVFSRFENLGDEASEAPFLSQAELGQIVAAATEVAGRFEEPDFRIALAGSPVASSEIVRVLSSDMPRFTLFSLIGMLVVVAVFTQSITAPLSLLVTVVVTGVSAIGLLAATGTPIKPPTQILPAIVIVASACVVLHLFAALKHARRDIGPATPKMPESACKERALAKAMHHIALPVFFTTLTTGAGLLSFAWSPLAPVSDLGLFGAAAVTIAMIVGLIVTSGIFRMMRFRPGAATEPGPAQDGMLLTLAMQVADFSARNWMSVLQGTALLAIVAALGFFGLRFHHNSLEWLPPENHVRLDTETIDAKMHGTINLEAVVDTGRKLGVQDERVLKTLDGLAADMPEIAAVADIQVGKVFGVTDILKEVDQALRAGGSADEELRLPKGNLIPRQFLLFENSASNDLPDFVDSKYQKTRVTIRVPWLEAGEYTGLIGRVDAELNTRLDVASVEGVTLTGNMALLAQISVNVLRSMAASYGLSIALVSILMAAMMGRLRLGIATMVPNLLPVFAGLGVMGFLDIPLDSFTMLIGCIALGLIVDDTIHFFHQLKQAEDDGMTGQPAIRHAVRHSFLPILATSVAVMVGFACFGLSTMSNVIAFGILMATVSLAGLLADMIVSPSIYAAMIQFPSRKGGQSIELVAEPN